MKKTNTTGVKFGAICLGLAVCVVGARCARAQNALGTGRALDRNLQHGSGGVNTQVRDLNALIRFNNSVVTGNAANGRAFRGNVGYLAGDDFRAATGTDALYEFRRDAATSALVAAGIRGTDALQYQFALSTGQAPPHIMGNIPDFSGGFARGANPIHSPQIITNVESRPITGSTAATALRSTADYNTQQILRPSILGYREEPDGSRTVLTASPLLGVNWSSMGNPPGPVSPEDAGSNDPNRTGRMLTGLEPVPSYISSPVGLVESFAPTRVQTRVETPAIVMDALKLAIDENAKKAPARPGDAKPGDTNRPATPGSPSSDTNAEKRPAWEQEMERIRKHLGGIEDLKDPRKDDKKPVEPAVPDEAKDEDKPTRLQSLIEPATGKINTDVLKALQATRPTLVRLAPEAAKQGDSYAAHMSRGEALLAASQYFDAEDSFVRALALHPRDPLANVGRIHAELGAGMFLSAAANLKSFFSQHPEMIGARYAPSLLPSDNRAKIIAEQLRMNIADPTSATGKESGMLLGYLGYQRRDPALTREGIEAMAAKTYPEQTVDVLLLGLLQRIWVEGRDTPPAPPAEKPAAPAPATPPADQDK